MGAVSLSQFKKGRDGRRLLVTEDVFDVAKGLTAIDPSLCLRWNDVGEYFVVYQRFENGDEKLVTTTHELSPALLRRVEEITHPSYDYVAEMERMDREADKAREHAFNEKVGEIGERLAHAVRKDVQAQNKVFIPDDVA